MIRFYTVHWANLRPNQQRSPICWSRPFDGPAAAKSRARDILDEGDASVVFIVRAAGDDKRILYVVPPSAAKIIERYKELSEALNLTGEGS